MRFGWMAAAAAMVTAGQAEAATFLVGGTAAVTVTRTTQGPAGCSTFETCFLTTNYNDVKTLPTTTLTLAEGASETITVGGIRSGSGQYTATITNNGGFLLGTNFRYFYESCSPTGGPQPGCYTEQASAPTFNVTGGVPEPTTWAMMLTGFALLGYAMRQRRRQTSRLGSVILP